MGKIITEGLWVSGKQGTYDLGRNRIGKEKVGILPLLYTSTNKIALFYLSSKDRKI